MNHEGIEQKTLAHPAFWFLIPFIIFAGLLGRPKSRDGESEERESATEDDE